jgi:hypothetical protein
MPLFAKGGHRASSVFLPSVFDIRYSLFQSFFFDQTGRFSGRRLRSYETSLSFFYDQTGRSRPEEALI